MDLTDGKHGAHGGVLVATGDGFLEISVFETGVLPHFRLYFLDEDHRLLSPPSADSVVLETVRPEGTRQSFEFADEADFLESTSNIPEPHEFEVVATVTSSGAAQRYAVPFVEEDHGHSGGHDHAGAHSHGDGHSHEGHGHDHDRGLFARIRGVFGHSHAVEDKIDASMESNARGIWALKIGLLGLFATAAFQLAIVVISGSVGLLADTIHNFGDAGTSIPLWIAFSLARRKAGRKFTYGYGKTEDIAGVLIILIIFFSACVAAWESIRKIIHPEPVTHLWWAAAAAIVGFLGNEAVAVFRIRVGNEIGSAALVADGKHARIDGITSLAVLVGLIGVYFGVPILDPIIGIIITIAILFIVKDTGITVWTRRIDGIEPGILAAIEHAPSHVAGVRAVTDVRARWIGHQIFSDLAIVVDPALPVGEADVIARRVQRSLKEHVRLLGDASVRIIPRSG